MFTLRQFLQLTSVSILLLLTSALIANSIIGQQCIPASNISEILRVRAPNPTDGKIHITYSFSESNLSTTSKAAFDNAIGQWNSKSGSTGVFFDPAPAGSSGDVEFKRSTDPADTGRMCCLPTCYNSRILRCRVGNASGQCDRWRDCNRT